MIDKNRNSEDIKFFLDAVLKLKNMEECQTFFEDVCTTKELEAISQRLRVAQMLKDGETYISIVAKTGASTATISRVNRCFNYGDGGYNMILERMENGYES